MKVTVANLDCNIIAVDHSSITCKVVPKPSSWLNITGTYDDFILGGSGLEKRNYSMVNYGYASAEEFS